jgi:hypothetical protein
MAHAGIPQDGDVVIRRDDSADTPLYALSAAPGPDQFGYGRPADAERMARCYAEYAAVDVWRAEGLTAFSLIARFRGPTTHAPRHLRSTAETVHAASRRMHRPGGRL